ncbi:MAG: PfaD family polyunsaturated fatty acid/polyketide biosynthesis protein [Myxococcota bacterium]
MAAGFNRASASIGRWRGDPSAIAASRAEIAAQVHRVHEPLFAVDLGGTLGFTASGEAVLGADAGGDAALAAFAPVAPASALGDPSFAKRHGLRFNYVAGAMAGGIASVELVEAMARAGMLGMYGAAGLDLDTVEAALHRLSTRLLDRPWGANLIHSPYEPELERGVVELYLRRGVHLVSASAYLDITRPLLRYRLHGLRRGPDGTVVAPNRVLAKVSRVEVAEKFLSPPSPAQLRTMVEAGELDAAAAVLAENLPIASDLTVEADSGGHTDNRPALTLLPTMIALRDRIAAARGYAETPRVGAAGGIGTPAAAAAAFAMGAAYVVTGTINQACLEAGTSDTVRTMLAEAGQADVAMAPAADMFEMGVELQVLRRGTLFPMRARKLWEVYRAHASLEDIAAVDRDKLERTSRTCALGTATEIF